MTLPNRAKDGMRRPGACLFVFILCLNMRRMHSGLDMALCEPRSFVATDRSGRPAAAKDHLLGAPDPSAKGPEIIGAGMGERGWAFVSIC